MGKGGGDPMTKVRFLSPFFAQVFQSFRLVFPGLYALLRNLFGFDAQPIREEECFEPAKNP
jgi:hypothetical protein